MPVIWTDVVFSTLIIQTKSGVICLAEAWEGDYPAKSLDILWGPHTEMQYKAPGKGVARSQFVDPSLSHRMTATEQKQPRKIPELFIVR